MEEGVNSVLALVAREFGEPKTKASDQSPLTLAFIGDAIYSLIFRSIVVNEGNTANGKLHSKTTQYVSAKAQAAMADIWLDGDLLTEEEHDIYRRGVNAKPKSQAKNASSYEYHKATGVEALAGYLYQTGQLQRLVQLIKIGLK